MLGREADPVSLLAGQLLKVRRTSKALTPDCFSAAELMLALPIVAHRASANASDRLAGARIVLLEVLDDIELPFSAPGSWGRVFFGATNESESESFTDRYYRMVGLGVQTEHAWRHGYKETFCHDVAREILRANQTFLTTLAEAPSTALSDEGAIEAAFRSLSRARGSSLRSEVQTHLRQGLRDIEGLPASTDVRLVGSWLHREWAIESTAPDDRRRHWKEAIRLLQDDSGADPTLACERGSIAVDAFQDGYSSMARADRIRELDHALTQLDRAKADPLARPVQARVLIRKAAVLRARALVTLRSEANFVQPLECAKRAAGLDDTDPGVPLELGLSQWALARHMKDNNAYGEELRKAEAFLKVAATRSEQGSLTLARFYRLHWRPMAACEAFPGAERTGNWRRLMRDSHVYAEAVIGLAYQPDLDRAEYEDHFDSAKRLLEQAIASGYDNARLIVDLAALYGFDDQLDELDAVLGGLMAQADVDWTHLAEVMPNLSDGDLVSRGFALGINDSATLNRLGTIANDFLDIPTLAERFYLMAVKAQPRNAAAHTNLAMLYRVRGGPDNTRRSKYHRSQAKRWSDKRFQWWRQVDLSTRERSVSTLPTVDLVAER